MVRAIGNAAVIGPIIRGGLSGPDRYWWVFTGGTSIIHEDGCVLYFERDLEAVG